MQNEVSLNVFVVSEYLVRLLLDSMVNFLEYMIHLFLHLLLYLLHSLSTDLDSLPTHPLHPVYLRHLLECLSSKTCWVR